MLSDILSVIAIAISLTSLYFAWKRTKKEQPLFKHEIISCKHKVAEDEKTTNLELVFRLHNRGDRGTKMLKIEAYATDFNGNKHYAFDNLSEYLKAHDSIKKKRAFFCFLPPFRYQRKMSCIFIIYHTNGKYPFEHESEESEDYLRRFHVGFI